MMHKSRKRQPVRKKPVQGIRSAEHRERESGQYFYPNEMDMFGEPMGPPRHFSDDRERREMPPRMMRSEWEDDWLFGPVPGPMRRQGPMDPRGFFGPGPHPDALPFPRPDEWPPEERQGRRNVPYSPAWRPPHPEMERFSESMEFRDTWGEQRDRMRREATSRQNRRESMEEWPPAYDETVSLDGVRRRRIPRRGSR
jgi:hypothetical protein